MYANLRSFGFEYLETQHLTDYLNKVLPSADIVDNYGDLQYRRVKDQDIDFCIFGRYDAHIRAYRPEGYFLHERTSSRWNLIILGKLGEDEDEHKQCLALCAIGRSDKSLVVSIHLPAVLPSLVPGASFAAQVIAYPRAINYTPDTKTYFSIVGNTMKMDKSLDGEELPLGYTSNRFNDGPEGYYFDDADSYIHGTVTDVKPLFFDKLKDRLGNNIKRYLVTVKTNLG